MKIGTTERETLQATLKDFTGRRCIFMEGRLFLSVRVVSVDVSDWGVHIELQPLETWFGRVKKFEAVKISAVWDILAGGEGWIAASWVGWEIHSAPEVINRVEAVGVSDVEGQERLIALIQALRKASDT